MIFMEYDHCNLHSSRSCASIFGSDMNLMLIMYILI